MAETIIQFGEGNFLRGFFDYFLDVMNKNGFYDGKAVVIQPRNSNKVQALNEQKCEYNLYLRGVQNGELKQEHSLIQSISRCVDPYKNYGDFIALADSPDFRFVVSNTTESGIEFREEPFSENEACTTFPAKVTQLLYRRFQNNLSGFVFLPCELIDNNADKLKQCIIKYANYWLLPKDFLTWIEKENEFSNTLVDRIVTGYPDDEIADRHKDDKFLNTGEIYHLWVIEGNYENELPFKKAGFNVIWTDNVSPYKKIKVRILNGAHTSLVAAGLLCGIKTVGECTKDNVVSSFLSECMEEILSVFNSVESRAFADAVFDRFKNPFINHKLESIALNSISKFSVRVLPTILEYKEMYEAYPKHLLLSLALLIYFYKNSNPQDDESTIAFIKNNNVTDILKNSVLWGRDISFLAEDVIKYYETAQTQGVKNTIEAL